MSIYTIARWALDSTNAAIALFVGLVLAACLAVFAHLLALRDEGRRL